MTLPSGSFARIVIVADPEVPVVSVPTVALTLAITGLNVTVTAFATAATIVVLSEPIARVVPVPFTWSKSVACTLAAPTTATNEA
jgi:hypothetical protein